MDPKKVNLKIYQGATFKWLFYWYSDTEVVTAITAVSLTYPAAITAAAHGLPTSDVPATIIGVPDWLKSPSLDHADRSYVTKTGTNTCTVKVDGTDQEAYDGSGGRLIYNAPIDLSSGWTARMQIRASIDDTTVISSFTSASGSIVLGADGLIELKLSATATDLLDFTSAVYDLELVETGSTEVNRVAAGKVTLIKQVTR